MTATVLDLISARARRQQIPLHFDTDVDALAWLTGQVNALRHEAATTLLVPSGPLELRLDQIASVLIGVADLYAHVPKQDEK